ncbi:hypothetical protein HHI36_017597 [Cryptolaemus montrouzieri]|uniref:AB hydrolase-1 domain-containing protein n=1 Tax=Cryptolaemus montrouzieri TaxID=559131 RepID=A0ABD2NP04_9CUCU
MSSCKSLLKLKPNFVNSLFTRCNVLAKTFSTAPREEIIHINSQKINYLKVGNGPKNILCFPGALGTILNDFKPQIEGLDKNKFTIVAWERPGHGKSRPPERVFTPKFYEEDADLACEFMKHIGFNSFSLLGWSDGGVSGLILAAKYPEVIEKLVVWGTSSYVLSHEIDAFEKIRYIKDWSERARAPFVEYYGEKIFQELQHSWCDAMKELMKNGGDICSPLLKDIKCDTFILYGDKDPLVDPCHVDYLMKNIKGAKLHRFPEGRHNIHIRCIKEFNEKVTEFLLK